MYITYLFAKEGGADLENNWDCGVSLFPLLEGVYLASWKPTVEVRGLSPAKLKLKLKLDSSPSTIRAKLFVFPKFNWAADNPRKKDIDIVHPWYSW